MRVLVISDVHANLEALTAVLADAADDYDAVWSLGDAVGYGPDPAACVQRLLTLPLVAIPGNHDWGAIGKLDLEQFNEDARLANLWTSERLSAAARAFLESLPETRIEAGVTLAHGSPRAPVWEYLLYASAARVNFDYFETWLCLVGHTHVPAIFRLDGEGRCHAVVPPEAQRIQLDEQRYILNPGGVGQPRDGDPRAAYLLLDVEERIIEFRRVAYDFAETQRKMRAADLPPRLSARLEYGF